MAPGGRGTVAAENPRSAAAPSGGPGSTSRTWPSSPGSAMTGGGCPAEATWIRSEAGDVATTTAVAIFPGSKNRNSRSVSSRTSSGLAPRKAWPRIIVRRRPITTAEGSPWPATSPTLSQTSPDGSRKTSYQSPPTPRWIAGAYRAANLKPGTTGSAAGTRLRSRIAEAPPDPVEQGVEQVVEVEAGQTRVDEGPQTSEPALGPARRAPAGDRLLPTQRAAGRRGDFEGTAHEQSELCPAGKQSKHPPGLS